MADDTPTTKSGAASAEHQRVNAESLREHADRAGDGGEDDRAHSESAKRAAEQQESLREIAEQTQQTAEDSRHAINSMVAVAEPLSANLALPFPEEARSTLRPLAQMKPRDIQ